MAELADDGVKTPAEIETATTESPTERTNDDGVISLDGGIETEEEAQEGAEKQGEPEEKTEDEAEAANPEAKSDGTSPKNAETRKQQLNNEIRDKVAERNALRKEIAELNQQKYQMMNQSDLPTVEAMMEQINPDTGDYYTRTEAKLARIEAERELEMRQRQMDEYTDNIVDNRLRLRDEAEQAIRDFPMFDENSDSYNKELATRADQIAESLLIKDETGEIIGSRGSVYSVYATVAAAAGSAETNGKIAGRKAAEKMMDSTDIIGSSSSSSSSDEDDNPFLKGFRKNNY